jgi:hypothetical protein
MAKAHMTALYWYQIELDKLIKVGYASGEAHKILKDRLATMTSIEWWDEDNNNLTLPLEKEAL